MPELSGIDLSQTYKPEPTGVQEFFSKLGKSYQDENDRVQIGKLLNDYRQNREDANAWEDLQLNLEQSSISPSRRLEAQQSLNEIRKQITERDKTLNAKTKNIEEKNPVKEGLNTLKRQREILASGHLGPKVGIVGKGRKAGSTFSKEGQKLRAEYERLGKSLIQLSTNIPIRNRKEFEVLAHDLYDTNKSQYEIEGTLNAMERILQGQLSGNDQSESKSSNPDLPEGQTATGPNGERIVFKGGQWQPM